MGRRKGDHVKFETLDSQQRGDIVNNRTNTTLTVDRATVGIQGDSGFAITPILSTHVELPPTPVELTEENVNQIFIHSGEGPRGAWIRFFIMVYFNGGRIFFKVFDDRQLEAVIHFP